MWLVSLLIILVFFSVSMVWYADRQRRLARESLSEELAEKAARLGRERYDVGLLTAVEALNYGDTFAARNAFFNLLQWNQGTLRFLPPYRMSKVVVDERTIVTSDYIWNIANGQSVPLGTEGWRMPLALSPDGHAVAFCGSFKDSDDRESIWLLDIRSGNKIATAKRPEDSCIGASANINSDATQVILAWGGAVHVWDLKTGQISNLPLEGWSGKKLVFGDGSRLLAGGNEHGSITTWESSTGHRLATSNAGHRSAITSIVFSPTANMLASGDETGAIVVWETAGLQPKLQTLKHYEEVGSLAFAPDEGTIAAGGPAHFGGIAALGKSNSHSLSIWDLATGASYPETVRLFGPIWMLHFMKGGKYLVAGTETGDVRFVEIGPGSVKRSKASLLATSSKLIVSVEAHVATLEEYDGGSKRILQIPENLDPVALSVAGESYALGCKDGTLLLGGPGQQGLRPIGRHASEVDYVELSRDGHQVAAAGKQGEVSLWDTSTGKKLWAQTLRANISALALSVDGTVAVGGYKKDWQEGFLTLVQSRNAPVCHSVRWPRSAHPARPETFPHRSGPQRFRLVRTRSHPAGTFVNPLQQRAVLPQ